MKKKLWLLATHATAVFVGFVLGIYLLPILIAPPAPTEEEAKEAVAAAMFTGEFRRDLKDSDALHWGEGTVSVGSGAIVLQGEIAPGPDYRLYLSPEFVETEADFMKLKASMTYVGDVKTFKNFIVELPEGIDPKAYKAVIVWCESFSQFITAARYQ